MNTYSIAVALHLGAGTIALITFWAAGLIKKGTALHRRVGQVYLLAMLGIVISAVPLVFGALHRGQSIGAIFLTYLIVLVVNGGWTAWRAIRDRRDRQRYFGHMFWTMATITALAGAGVIAVGIAVNSMLLMIFGSIGVVGLVGNVFTWKRAPSDPKWWLKEHYGAMIGNGVATHIAFLAIGLRRLLPDVNDSTLQMFAWFGPLVVAVMAGVWINRKYGRSGARVNLAATAALKS
jgi:uncharacterized membrane protein